MEKNLALLCVLGTVEATTLRISAEPKLNCFINQNKCNNGNNRT
jgi:hypothetical protein